MGLAGESKLLDINEISYDPDNPRIARVLEIFTGELTEDHVIMALQSNEAAYRKLKNSIKKCKTIIQPIIVNRLSSGKYVVIEGNTRLAIYKNFDKESSDDIWKEIPSIVKDNMDDEDMHAIRLQAHLVGPTEWGAYEKGKYLHHLYHDELLTLNQIVEYTGGSQRSVELDINAFEDMHKYYSPIVDEDHDFNPSNFSAFREIQNTNYRNSLIKNGYSMNDFAKWIKDEKFTAQRHIRKLPEILSRDDLKQIFFKEGSRAAVGRILPQQDVTDLNDANVNDLASVLCDKLIHLELPDLAAMKSDAGHPIRESLSYLRSQIEEIFELIESDE